MAASVPDSGATTATTSGSCRSPSSTQVRTTADTTAVMMMALMIIRAKRAFLVSRGMVVGWIWGLSRLNMDTTGKKAERRNG